MFYHYDLAGFPSAFVRIRLGMSFRYVPGAAPQVPVAVRVSRRSGRLFDNFVRKSSMKDVARPIEQTEKRHLHRPGMSTGAGVVHIG